VLLEVVLVICDTEVTSADELIMKGVDLIWSNSLKNTKEIIKLNGKEKA